MATINVRLAAGSTASPFYHEVTITKQLCAKTCHAPVFSPTFSVVDYKLVGTQEYEVLVNVQGIVTYTPCKSCCAKSQAINENFILPFKTATAPTAVSVTGGTPRNRIITGNGCGTCNRCGNTFVCDVPLDLTVTTA